MTTNHKKERPKASTVEVGGEGCCGEEMEQNSTGLKEKNRRMTITKQDEDELLDWNADDDDFGDDDEEIHALLASMKSRDTGRIVASLQTGKVNRDRGPFDLLRKLN